VAAIAAVAYHFGSNGVQNSGPFMNRRGFGMMGSAGAGWGWGWDVLPGLILVFVVIFVFVALITGIDRPAQYRSADPTTPTTPMPGAPATDDVARLRELADLHDRGGLTDDEFSAAKKKILGL
jgi:uncharacterized membrane protein